MCDVFCGPISAVKVRVVAHIYQTGCVFGPRDALVVWALVLSCMGVLGMSDSVGSRRHVLYVYVLMEFVLGIHWWSESRC